jgi:hypothetical protein
LSLLAYTLLDVIVERNVTKGYNHEDCHYLLVLRF